jgi:predicted house-cleaning NTP pyrophosphatase (Maf/HAM1 superfamily)
VYDKERNGAVRQAVRTKVFFKHLRDEEIASYIATGCPFDKAGAYAIQGGAAHMVQKIEGSFPINNVTSSRPSAIMLARVLLYLVAASLGSV